MNPIAYISLALLGIFGGAQILKRPSRVFKYLFYISILIVFVVLAYFTYAQYRLWHVDGSVTRFFFPPYQSWNFFIIYSLSRFWAPYLVSMTAAFVFLAVMKILNKKFGGIFFYEEEPYLLASSLLLVGHPLWLVYIFGVIGVQVLVSTLRSLLFKKRERTSFLYLWVPLAILVIILKKPLLSLPFLAVLRFAAAL